jgi:tRNA 2-thiouridine synthesizing protein C
MTDSNKRILFIASRSPYADERAQELLDMLLVCSTFGADVSVLFDGDGLWQLLPDQASDQIGRRSIAAQLSSLPLFDVDRIYADAKQLAQLPLPATELCLPCQPLSSLELTMLITQHEHIVRL